jgi:hypothetical protein
MQTLEEILPGPCFLPPCVTGAVYPDFLWNFLPELLQDVDLQTMIHLWFMHDGVPPHFRTVGGNLVQCVRGTIGGTR